MIVILDASVIVSAALKPGSVPDRAVTRVSTGPDRLVLSPEIADEYSAVLFRPKFARLSVHRRAEFLRLISAAAKIVVPTEQVQA